MTYTPFQVRSGDPDPWDEVDRIMARLQANFEEEARLHREFFADMRGLLEIAPEANAAIDRAREARCG